MSIPSLNRLLAVSLGVLGMVGASGVLAQSTPPIKPGLWEIHNDRQIDGRPAPDLGEQLKKMPPEMRKRMEANMRQRGVDMSGGGTMKMCMTKESLDKGRWQGDQGSCKVDFVSQTSSSWKWKSSCTQPPSQSEGEATFQSPEAYTVKSSSTVTMRGQPRTSMMVMNAKWLGADCGDLKPIEPRRKVAPNAKP